MTCEDYDERNGPGIVEKVALLIAPLLASRRDPRAGAVTALRREEAIVTVLLTMVNVVLPQVDQETTFLIDVLTRSRLSRTAKSGNPTVVTAESVSRQELPDHRPDGRNDG